MQCGYYLRGYCWFLIGNRVALFWLPPVSGCATCNVWHPTHSLRDHTAAQCWACFPDWLSMPAGQFAAMSSNNKHAFPLSFLSALHLNKCLEQVVIKMSCFIRSCKSFFFFFSCGFTTWNSRLYFCHYKNHRFKFTACRIKQWESAAAWKSAGWGDATWIGGSDTHALKTSDHSLDADTCQLQTTHIPLVFKSN